MTFDLYLGNCLDTLQLLDDNSVDSIVTDPPYGLSFMGKRWDYDVPSVEVWAECLRVLKPGGHLLAFAGTRTQHRMAVRIEDAGFEIRDMIAWVYGSGFPKSLDVSKAIDKAAGAEREVVGVRRVAPGVAFSSDGPTELDITATDAARQWQGWGTALKPALEPITVARKPLIGSVAENVLAHGTGAINVDGCRVEPTGESRERIGEPSQERRYADSGGTNFAATPGIRGGDPSGRWPANLIHDGSDEVLAAFPQAPGQMAKAAEGGDRRKTANAFGEFAGRSPSQPRGDTGSAARFFYCAKASKSDRNEGLDNFTPATTSDGRAKAADNAYQRGKTERANTHPTVKPTDLMRYLCRLVTPPGGIVLDPFMGSGSTGKAAVLEGFRFIGCELSPEYMAIAQARIAHALTGGLV